MSDPTAPLNKRSPEEISEYIDDHIIMALQGADYLYGDRDLSEDYVRDRLVALGDSFPDPAALAAEEARRRMARLQGAIFGGS